MNIFTVSTGVTFESLTTWESVHIFTFVQKISTLCNLYVSVYHSDCKGINELIYIVYISLYKQSSLQKIVS